MLLSILFYTLYSNRMNMEKTSFIEPTFFNKLALGIIMVALVILIGKEGYEFGQWLKQ